MPLRYFGIRVRELGRSVEFYTRLLGLREVRRGQMAHGGEWVLLEDPKSRQRLELNWYPKGSRFATKFRSGENLDHIGFTEGRNAARKYRTLVANGAVPAMRPGTVPGMDGIYYVKDPDGNWIEFF